MSDPSTATEPDGPGDQPNNDVHAGATVGNQRHPDGPPRLVIIISIVAVLITVGAVVTGFALASRIGSQQETVDTGPLALPPAPAPGASGQYCSELMGKLPQKLADEPRRTLSTSADGVAAWGSPPIVLRCGLTNPAELTCASRLTTFTSAEGIQVSWLMITEGSAVSYVVADRPVRIAVTLPPGVGVGPIQQLSEVIGDALPTLALCTDGTVSTPDNT